MPRTQGVYSLPAGNPVQSGTTIESDWANSTMGDVANALTNSIARDGQTGITANLPMSGHLHTGVGDATARTHYGKVSQIQDGAYNFAGSVAGTNAVTGSLAPTISAYANGMRARLFPANTNTDAVTLALNGLTARAVVKFNGTALVAGDLVAGVPADVVYDLANLHWVLQNPQAGTAPANSISNAMLRQSAALSIIGRSANSTGNVADIAAASDHQVLRRSGTSIGFGQVNLASANAVTGTLPDARLSPNVPLKDAPNVFTSGTNSFSSATPRLQLDSTAAGLNQRLVDLIQTATALIIRSRTDADGGGATLFHGTRSGTAWSELQLNAMEIALTGTIIVNPSGTDILHFFGAGNTGVNIGRLGSTPSTNNSHAQIIRATNGATGLWGTGDVAVMPRSTSGTQRTRLLSADGTSLVQSAHTDLASAGGLFANNALTGAGLERVLTETDRTLATRSTSATLAAGQVHARSANTTINTGLTAGAWVGIQNVSASDITLTQGSGLTLRMTGTSETGSRTLVARGRAMVWANTSTEYYISGDIT